jgi:hypothetical protein
MWGTRHLLSTRRYSPAILSEVSDYKGIEYAESGMSQIKRYSLGKMASAATWPITSGDEEDGMVMMQ